MNAAILEDYDWESEDSEDWESDEAFEDDFDSAEDIGEARRRRRARRGRGSVRPFRPVGGVQGVAVRDPSSGGVRNLAFPKKLATAADTNRGLANQELARRNLAARVNDLETRRRRDLRNANQATGLASLAMIGGLSGYAAMKAFDEPSGTRFKFWVDQTPTQMATATAAAQLIGSGASYLFTRGYHGGAVRIAADAVAAVQIAAFAYGSVETSSTGTDKRGFHQRAQADQHIARTKPPAGTLYINIGTSERFEVVYDIADNPHLVPLEQPEENNRGMAEAD